MGPDLAGNGIEFVGAHAADQSHPRLSPGRDLLHSQRHGRVCPRTSNKSKPWAIANLFSTREAAFGGVPRIQNVPKDRRSEGQRPRNLSLSIPSAAIFESSVCRGIPSLAAAPDAPATRPPD